ncbi:MAG: hypothetical protein K2X39_03385 [Silvanigrellaceae bacterium]|nr:hypothetical protein [Silvanigrellaceae bacterium]
MPKNRFKFSYQKPGLVLTTALLTLLAEPAFADELPALTGAVDKITGILISIALTVLSLQIIYGLWQVNQGHKEWREVVKPILITAAIVSVPAIVGILRAVLR